VKDSVSEAAANTFSVTGAGVGAGLVAVVLPQAVIKIQSVINNKIVWSRYLKMDLLVLQGKEFIEYFHKIYSYGEYS
jgi:hypothetical protein